ncbi:MAG TPA: phage head closure protein [Novosphingobium sp.]
MRAGRLDRTITIQAFTNTVDDFGTPVEDWSDFATLRAQIVQGSTEEFLREFGASDETAIVFRTRYLSGVTTEQRVSFDGKVFNIRETKETGRRKGLEIRAVAT